MSDPNNNFFISDADGLPPEDRPCAICGKLGSLFEYQWAHWYNNSESFSDDVLWLCDGHQLEVRTHIENYISTLAKTHKRDPLLLGKDSQTYKNSVKAAHQQRAELLEDEIKLRLKAIKEQRYDGLQLTNEDGNPMSSIEVKAEWEAEVKNMMKILEHITGFDFPNRIGHLSNSERKKLQ